MRYFLIGLLALVWCMHTTLVEPKDELSFGDYVKVVSGPYKGSTALIHNEIDDHNKQPCMVHQYYAEIKKNGLTALDYVCHEDLRIEQ